VTPYIIRNESGVVAHSNVEYERNLSAYRFTVDYPKDFYQVKKF